MKLAIIGTGYVGLPTGVGFAELGFDVVCVDKMEEKIKKLSNGELTLYEDGLEELFVKNVKAGKLTFTTSTEEAVKDANVVMLAVGTPENPVTHEADMKYIHAAAEELAPYLTKYTVIADKSTVPVGTAQEVEDIVKRVNPKADFDVVSLPEFLREGFAIYDFFNPDRIVVGADNERAADVIRRLYKSFETKTKFLFVNRKSSEAIKYASNSFLAMKIHFINEMANFCEQSGADVREVAKGMGMDSRIGEKFLNAGPGFGGGCFPKDTNAMAKMARKHGVELSLVETTIEKNYARKSEMAKRIIEATNENEDARVAILGLAFKGGTDDVRESPAMEILEELIGNVGAIAAYDPKGMDNAKALLGGNIEYAKDVYEACRGANVAAILTEWEEFRNLDLNKLKAVMKGFNIIDLRNMLDADKVIEAGFKYQCIGRR